MLYEEENIFYKILNETTDVLNSDVPSSLAGENQFNVNKQVNTHCLFHAAEIM